MRANIAIYSNSELRYLAHTHNITDKNKKKTKKNRRRRRYHVLARYAACDAFFWFICSSVSSCVHRMTQKKLHGLAEILDMDLYMLCEMVSGIFVPKTIRSLEHSFPGPFVPWNFRSRYPGPFLPQTIRSFVSRTVSGPLTKKNSVTN